LEHIEHVRANENQASLFDAMTDDDITLDAANIELEHFEEWSIKTKLGMEKQAIGYYLSGSLFEEYKDLVRKLPFESLNKYSVSNDEMQDLINNRSSYNRPKEKIQVCGVINYIGSRPLKKGGKMYFVKIEDDSGELEFILYDSVYEEFKTLIKEDEMVFIEGELMYDQFRNEIKITARQVYNLEAALRDYVLNMTLHIDNNFNLSELTPMLGDNGAKLSLHYNNGFSSCKLNAEKQLIPSYENIIKINSLLGKHSWLIG
jgi:DNA polymerase-3 subunit alpha